MNARDRLLRVLPWLLLFGCLVAFGFWVRSVQPWQPDRPGPLELHGMDYRRYGQMLEHWQMIFYAAFRHPLYGWILSPVIGFGARFRTLGEWPYWGWLIAVFSAVMTLAHFLVYRLLRRLSLGRLEAASLTALFASFAFSWLLAACPESFNISCLLALVTLHFALYVHRHADTMDRRLEYAGWGALAVLTGGITSTQAVKTALAYFVTKRPTRRRVLLVGAILFGVGLLISVVFLVRLYLRTPSGSFGREFAAALGNISTYLVSGGKSVSWRLGRAFVFFTEPLVTRGRPFCENVLPTSYASPFMALLALVPLLAATVSAWFGRRDLIVRLIAAMFLVEIGLHFVLFWGMDEAQIYAGHWFYAVPILIGVGLSRLTGGLRRVAPLAIMALAAILLAINFQAWFLKGCRF